MIICKTSLRPVLTDFFFVHDLIRIRNENFNANEGAAFSGRQVATGVGNCTSYLMHIHFITDSFPTRRELHDAISKRRKTKLPALAHFLNALFISFIYAFQQA
jgi:hypothetical protein